MKKEAVLIVVLVGLGWLWWRHHEHAIEDGTAEIAAGAAAIKKAQGNIDKHNSSESAEDSVRNWNAEVDAGEDEISAEIYGFLDALS